MVSHFYLSPSLKSATTLDTTVRTLSTNGLENETIPLVFTRYPPTQQTFVKGRISVLGFPRLVPTGESPRLRVPGPLNLLGVITVHHPLTEVPRQDWCVSSPKRGNVPRVSSFVLRPPTHKNPHTRTYAGSFQTSVVVTTIVP